MTPGAIADAELRARLARVQEELGRTGRAAVICFAAHRDYFPGDVRYLSRHSCTDEETAYVFVPRSGPSTLVIDAEWDLDRARAEAFAGEILLDRTPADTLAALVAGAARPGDTVGITGMGVFPAPVHRALLAAHPGIAFDDAGPVLDAIKLVKSDAEIALLREASRISDAGMRAGLDLVAEGVLETEVAAAAEYAIRRAGAELSFATVMGAGPRTADATFFPRRRAMEAGDHVILDCGARVEGYHGDMCRTVIVGPPSAEQRRVLEAVERCVHAAIAAARPGATVRDVHEAARGSVVRDGFGDHWWGYYMPHGAGTGQHELPAGLDDAELVLVPGMVMCIEPGVALPGVGGVILEQMVAVGATGAEPLNALGLDLWDRPA
jgi:Xaa-Pro aminopeptidase